MSLGQAWAPCLSVSQHIESCPARGHVRPDDPRLRGAVALTPDEGSGAPQDECVWGQFSRLSFLEIKVSKVSKSVAIKNDRCVG